MAKKKASLSRKVKRYEPTDKEILNADGAAEMLGISKRLLLRLAREGVVPGQKLGREWRFIRSDVRASISSGVEEESLQKLLSKLGATITPGRKRKR